MRQYCIGFVTILSLAACGGGGSSSDPDARIRVDAAPPDASPASVATFEPPPGGVSAPWGAIPYPSDLFLDAQGRLAPDSFPVGDNASAPAMQAMKDSLLTMNGAGVRSNVYFPVSGDVDPNTLDGNVKLVVTTPSFTEIPVDVIWRADLGCIVAAPKLGNILREDTVYGAYVTSAVKDTQGRAIERAPNFAAAADLTTTPTDDPVAKAQTSIRPLLEGLGAEAANVVTATVFKTQSVTKDAVAMHGIIGAATPTVTADTVYSTPTELDSIFGAQDPSEPPGMVHGSGNFRNQPHGNVAALIHGTIGIANFLHTDPGVAGFITYDTGGKPEVKGTHSVKYTLILPKGGSLANTPVLVYVAGINRPRNDMLVQAKTATDNGFALMAIDMPYHGDRDPDPRDVRNDMTGEATPDGFGDEKGLAAATRIFHLIPSGGIDGYHPQAMRENLRQAAMDVCSLVEYIADGDVTPIQTALDNIGGFPNDLSFRGDVGLITESFGAMVSSVCIAVEPRIGAAVFASPAAGFPFPSMVHSPNYSGTFFGVVTGPYDIAQRVVLGDPIQGARFEPMIMFYNNILESGEGAGFAPYVVEGSLRGGTGPNLLATESWADEWVSNDTTEHFAGAMGLSRMTTTAPMTPPAAPNRFVPLPEVAAPVQGNMASGAQTAALVVFYPSPHAVLRKLTDLFEYEPDYPPFVKQMPAVPIDPTPIVQVHRTWGTFMSDHFAGSGAPRIIDPYASN